MRINRCISSVIITGLLAMGGSACGGAGAETAGGGPCDVKVSTDVKNKPEITVPDCDKPTELQTREIVEGTGTAAKAGDAVAVNYTGVAWSTKKQFDSSWAPGRKPYVVQPLGQASVIAGWNQGLVGVKQGGRRLIVIPSALGYGQQGKGENIGPGEALVFVVDIVSINGR